MIDRAGGPLPEVRGHRTSANGTPQSASSHELPNPNTSGSAGNDNGVNASGSGSGNGNGGSGGAGTGLNGILGRNSAPSEHHPFLATNFTDVPVHQAFEATGFMDSSNSTSAMDFLGPVEGIYDAINFPEGILDFQGWASFFSNEPGGDSGFSNLQDSNQNGS